MIKRKRQCGLLALLNTPLLCLVPRLSRDGGNTRVIAPPPFPPVPLVPPLFACPAIHIIALPFPFTLSKWFTGWPLGDTLSRSCCIFFFVFSIIHIWFQWWSWYSPRGIAASKVREFGMISRDDSHLISGRQPLGVASDGDPIDGRWLSVTRHPPAHPPHPLRSIQRTRDFSSFPFCAYVLFSSIFHLSFH